MPTANGVEDVSLESVIAEGRARNAGPDGIAGAVNKWWGMTRDYGEQKLAEVDPEKLFVGNDHLDDVVGTTLTELKAEAYKKWATENFPNQESFDEFKMLLQQTDGDPENTIRKEGEHSMEDFMPALANLRHLESKSVYDLPKPASKMFHPIMDDVGNELAVFQARPNRAGGMDVLVNAHKPGGELNRALLRVAPVKPEDIEAEQQRIDGEIEKQTGAISAADATMADIREKYTDKTTGVFYPPVGANFTGVGAAKKEAQVKLFEAEQRREIMATGEAAPMLFAERVTEALKKSPLGAKVGESGVAALGEDAMRGFARTLYEIGALQADVRGQKEERDAWLEVANGVMGAYPGSTGSRFRGGAENIAPKLAELGGTFAPAIAANALVPGAGAVVIGAQAAGGANAGALELSKQYREAAHQAETSGDKERAARYVQMADDVENSRGQYATATGITMALAGHIIPGFRGEGLVRHVLRGGTEMTGIVGFQGQFLDPAFTGHRMTAAETAEMAATGAGLGLVGHVLSKLKRKAAPPPVVPQGTSPGTPGTAPTPGAPPPGSGPGTAGTPPAGPGPRPGAPPAGAAPTPGAPPAGQPGGAPPEQPPPRNYAEEQKRQAEAAAAAAKGLGPGGTVEGEPPPLQPRPGTAAAEAAARAALANNDPAAAEAIRQAAAAEAARAAAAAPPVPPGQPPPVGTPDVPLRQRLNEGKLPPLTFEQMNGPHDAPENLKRRDQERDQWDRRKGIVQQAQDAELLDAPQQQQSPQEPQQPLPPGPVTMEQATEFGMSRLLEAGFQWDEASGQFHPKTPPASTIATAKTGAAVELTVFRGTGRTEQGSIYTQEGTGPILGPGEYHALDADSATAYGPNVSQSKVSLKNPLVIDSDQQWRDLVVGKLGWEFPNPFGLPVDQINSNVQKLHDHLKTTGHDGVIIRLAEDDRTKTMRNLFGHDQVFIPSKTPAVEGKGVFEPSQRSRYETGIQRGLLEMDGGGDLRLSPSNVEEGKFDVLQTKDGKRTFINDQTTPLSMEEAQKLAVEHALNPPEAPFRKRGENEGLIDYARAKREHSGEVLPPYEQSIEEIQAILVRAKDMMNRAKTTLNEASFQHWKFIVMKAENAIKYQQDNPRPAATPETQRLADIERAKRHISNLEVVIERDKKRSISNPEDKARMKALKAELKDLLFQGFKKGDKVAWIDGSQGEILTTNPIEKQLRVNWTSGPLGAEQKAAGRTYGKFDIDPENLKKVEPPKPAEPGTPGELSRAEIEKQLEGKKVTVKNFDPTGKEIIEHDQDAVTEYRDNVRRSLWMKLLEDCLKGL